MYDSLELVIQNNDSMCKILPTTLQGFARVWSTDLEPGPIERLSDLCALLVACFSTNIPSNKISIELFGVTQQECESTRAYLKRFNKKMLKVEELFELIALEA